MPPETSPSGIYEWIRTHTRPKVADSAALRFERMESQADHQLPEIHKPLDPRSPAHWHHRGMIWDFVLAMAGAERVLDVGPGDGWPALLLAPHFKEVVGIEPGPHRVAACQENAKRMRTRNVHFEQMSVCKMAFPSESFDAVVACSSIEQTPDPLAALREVYRVLKPKGVLRMSYEVLDGLAEPTREAVSIRALPEGGSYQIDYVITWTEKAEEFGFLCEVNPQGEANAKRLSLWARRCQHDTYPHRDPRLERGLAATILGLDRAEVRAAQSFRLRHFKTRPLLAAMRRIGFKDVRLIVGGGWPARECALEFQHSQRIAAAAPVMEEICRCAGRVGIALDCERPGNLIARKPERLRRRSQT